jgi:hypothetical protein
LAGSRSWSAPHDLGRKLFSWIERKFAGAARELAAHSIPERAAGSRSQGIVSRGEDFLVEESLRQQNDRDVKEQEEVVGPRA